MEFRTVKIGDICEVVTDYVANGSFKSLSENVKYYDKGYARVIRLVDYNNKFEKKDSIWVSKDAYEFLKKSKLEGGEIVITNVVNNTTYGMTGGQMAPTTLPGQVTQTTPYGRDVHTAGHPVKICELMSTLDGVALAQRVAIDSPAHIREAKNAIRKAFDNEANGRGLSIVEVLSTCPTNWGVTPAEAMEFVRSDMIPYYPLGVYKDITAGEKEAR